MLNWLNRITCALWAEFVRNPRLYALLAGQPVLLGTVVWLAALAAAPRWGHPVEQLDILKWLVIALAVTHAIVAIAMAAVRVKGTGPGFSLDVGGDEDDPPQVTATAAVTVDRGS